MRRFLCIVAACVLSFQIACFDPCRSQCELAAGSCDEIPIEELPDFDTQLAQWRADVSNVNCEEGFPFLVAGECGNGMPFVMIGNGYTSDARFYSADDHEFIGLKTGTDVAFYPCFGQSYWPRKVQCADAVVTEVVCTTYYLVGDPIDFQ